MRCDDAVKGRADGGVAVIDLRDLRIGLRLLQIGLRVVAIGGGRIQRRLRDRLPLHQFDLPLEIGFRLFQRSLCTGLRGLRLFKLELVGIRLDREKRLALLDARAVLVVDRLQEALHARDEVDRFHRRGIAGGVDEPRDILLHGYGDVHLGRWRWHICILLAGDNAMAADIADTTRIVALSRSRKKTFIFEYAGVRACLISVPLSRLVLKKSSWVRKRLPAIP